MDRIETLQLRPYRPSDKEQAIAVFNQLVPPDPYEGLRTMLLLQDTTLKSDLCIVLRWRQPTPVAGKSPLGRQLATVFSEFGGIDHNVWCNTGPIFRSLGKVGNPVAPHAVPGTE